MVGTYIPLRTYIEGKSCRGGSGIIETFFSAGSAACDACIGAALAIALGVIKTNSWGVRGFRQ